MERQSDLFDQYLNNELSQLEKEHFETKLRDDLAFNEAFQLHQKSIRAIQFAAIKDKLSDISRNAQQSKTMGIRSALAIAASVLLLVGAYFYVRNEVKQPTNHDQIFASINFKDPGLPILMGEAEHDRALDDFMLAYKQNKYKEALTIGRELLKKNPDSDTIQFYTAMTLYEMGNLDAASEILITLEGDETGIAQKSAWYLYMIDLKNGDLRSAKAGIMGIAENPKHMLRLEAIDALEVLNLIEIE